MVDLMMPQTETERLILRSIRLSDAEDFYAYACDPEVTRYLTWSPHTSLKQTEQSIREHFLSRTQQGHLSAWVLELKETGKMIGTCDTGIYRPLGTEIGYAMNRTYWGRD